MRSHNAWDRMQVYKSLLAEAKRHGSLQYKKLEYVSKVISKGDMFLDVGCGTCCLLLEIVDRFRLLIGVDIDAVALYMCKRRLARFSNIELVRCDARRLPFRDSLFDFVKCLDILEHTDAPKGVLNVVFKILKQKGVLIVSVPNWYDRIMSRIQKTHGPTYSTHKSFHGSIGWAKTIRECGFKVLLLRTLSFPIIDVESFSKILHLFGECVLIVAQRQY